MIPESIYLHSFASIREEKISVLLDHFENFNEDDPSNEENFAESIAPKKDILDSTLI